MTFLMGAGFVFVAGLASWQGLSVVSILVFLGLYVMQNLRKPMNVAYISDQISQQVMASGLSVEHQFTTLLMVFFSPVLGALADLWGVGAALMIFGGVMFLFSTFSNVQDRHV